ncbi:uncharacterized protein LOC106663837 [Cimex lectularius]|uniref:Uncharacterized protein n=1 Tax=Cimex lectularius TaxID=79782 RepID=A0A8I6RFQ9_CIMLE|nr:uncharacterized protein LOC106663837 [Cimex lectularius]
MNELHLKPREIKPKKSTEFDYDELNRKLTRKRVLDQVADMIESETCPTERDSTSNLYRVLVKKLKVKIAELEEDPRVCEIAAKKLARWVEGMMKEAYGVQKLKNLSWATRSGFSSQQSVRKSVSAHSIKTLDATGEGHKPKEVVIEKVPIDRPLSFERTGQIYSAKLGGRRVYVEEVKDGNRLKALVSREKPNIKNPMVKEWSTWMVDLASKTKDWVKRIEDSKNDEVSSIGSVSVAENWNYLMEDTKTDSVAWRKRKLNPTISDSSSLKYLGGTSTESIWSRRDKMDLSTGHSRTRSPVISTHSSSNVQRNSTVVYSNSRPQSPMLNQHTRPKSPILSSHSKPRIPNLYSHSIPFYMQEQIHSLTESSHHALQMSRTNLNYDMPRSPPETSLDRYKSTTRYSSDRQKSSTDAAYEKSKSRSSFRLRSPTGSIHEKSRSHSKIVNDRPRSPSSYDTAHRNIIFNLPAPPKMDQVRKHY